MESWRHVSFLQLHPVTILWMTRGQFSLHRNLSMCGTCVCFLPSCDETLRKVSVLLPRFCISKSDQQGLQLSCAEISWYVPPTLSWQQCLSCFSFTINKGFRVSCVPQFCTFPLYFISFERDQRAGEVSIKRKSVTWRRYKMKMKKQQMISGNSLWSKLGQAI